MLDLLVIAPHPDDAELGMGGTILKSLQDGLRVGILDLTSGEPTPFGDIVTRRRETAAATEILGVSWRENLGLPNRSLEPTLDARRELAGVFRRVRPRWLFAPYWVDAHPDHTAATQLIEAARFWAKLSKSDIPGEPYHPERVIYYFCVHLRLAVEPTFIVDISAQYERKRAAISCFQSQFVQGKPTHTPNLIDRLRDTDAHFGRLIGTAYGEPFSLREPLGLSSLTQIV